MISVVVTTYGDEQWLRLAYERAVPSLASQEEHELVVYHSRELEIGPARNYAASQASGEWLLFLDADDELGDGYITAMYKAISATKERLPLFQPSVVYLNKARRLSNTYLLPPGDLRTENFLVIGTVVQRKLFTQVGGFENYEHGFEDWSLWAKCWKAGANVVQVPDAVYRAWVNPRSKHKLLWRNRKLQRAMHHRIEAELFPGGIDRWER